MYWGVLVRRIIGWFLVMFGVISLILPFLSGIIFILIGFYILSLDSVWWRKKLEEMEKKYPQSKKFISIFDGRMRKKGGDKRE
jgi:uncharacterized membrane protein YbaN (DUF454 family)